MDPVATTTITPPIEPAGTVRTTPPVSTPVIITGPADRALTKARSIVVTGTAPATPRGGETAMIVTVDRRRVEVDARNATFWTEVALTLGSNVLTATAEVYAADAGEPATVTSAPVRVTRMRAPDTGTLDRATAYLASAGSREVHGLCGEGVCGTEPRCFAVSAHRVDCPVGTWEDTSATRGCGLVMSVRVRQLRLYAGSYPCRGRMSPDPERFVRPAVVHVGKRVRVRSLAYDRLELNEPNRYGVPRVDADRNVFLP